MINIQAMYALAGLLLSKAETMFGLRDTRFQFLGIRFEDDGPCIRFDAHSSFGIHIALKSIAAADEHMAIYQLAHEVIHLLAPERSPPAFMIEEGLAVWFSIHGPDYPDPSYRQKCIEYVRTNSDAKNYRDALAIYEEIKEIEPEAIMKLRKKRANFFDMDAEFIRQMIPDIGADLADRAFERRTMR